jgi:hypothetical protein
MEKPGNMPGRRVERPQFGQRAQDRHLLVA